MAIIWQVGGETWENTSDKVVWQWHCSFVRSCAFCIEMHTAISFEPWPIPAHPNCMCFQIEIFPGEKAEPFADFPDFISRLPKDVREQAAGISVAILVKAGVIKWADVIAKDRVRTLAEIVRNKRLTVDAMVRAGVQRHIAERAWKAAHAPVEEILKRHREETERQISDAARHADRLREAVSAGVGGRSVSLSSGLLAPSGRPPLPAAPPVLPHGGDAATIRDYLRKWPAVPRDEDLWPIIEEEQPPRRRTLQPER